MTAVNILAIDPGPVLLYCFVPGVPKTAGSKRAFVNRYTHRAQVVEDCEKSKGWRSDVRTAVNEQWQGKPPLDVPLRMELRFQFVKKKANGWKATRPDALKLARAVEDALTGLVYVDDSLIVQEYLEKVYADRPGCVIRLLACTAFNKLGVTT